MKRYIILVLITATISWSPFIGRAQTGLNHNQFGQLRNSFNGSLSLMDPKGGAAVLGRLQWVGLDDAPRSYWASGHVGIKNLGVVGVNVTQTSLGVVRDREYSGYVASAMPLGKDQYIGLSIGGGILMHSGDYSDLDLSDPAFAGEGHYNKGIISVGISYFQENKYYFGISAPRFVLSKREQELAYDFHSVYYFTGGALFQMNQDLHIRPSVIVSYMEKNTTHFHVNALAFFRQKFGIGLGVQNHGDLSGLLQFNIGDFGIGYNYQFNPQGTKSTRHISNNTHEVGLRYRVGGMKML